MDPDLSQLGEPDPAAVDRVWRRFQRTRARDRGAWRRRVVVGAAVAVAASLLAVAWSARPEGPHELDVAASFVPETHVWSDQITLETIGHGTVTGTAKDARIAWEQGTVRAEVVPHANNHLTVVTDDATVEVLGTVFTVRRDALGSTVGVDRGRVRVTCADGWSGEVGAGDASHTCLPVTGAGLLGRAEAQLDAGTPAALVLDTLDRGVAVAPSGSPVASELLALRMRQHAELGRVDDALDDATRYLATPGASRTAEVQRFAGWLALSEQGCAAALPWLTALQRAGSVEESVLLAECVAPDEPDRARTLLLTALPALDPEWSDRAVRDLGALTPETP